MSYVRHNVDQMLMSEPIYFYGQTGPYACFSNFAPYTFELDSQYWPTVEHYFQAQKFAGTEYQRMRGHSDGDGIGLYAPTGKP